MTRPGPSRRRGLFAVVALGGAVLAGGVVWAATQPRSPAERGQAAAQLVSGIRISATVSGSSLAATRATADFGVAQGVRLVLVRIIDELQLELRVQTDRDVTLASPPRLCLVGPYSAPDDAGLTDRCWGEPDLSQLLDSRLAPDGAGRSVLAAASPIALTATLQRGNARCDYPPGTWRLEMTVDLVIDGSPTGDLEVPAGTFDLPFAGTTALPLISSARYCGLAETIYRDQGEPPVASPEVSGAAAP